MDLSFDARVVQGQGRPGQRSEELPASSMSYSDVDSEQAVSKVELYIVVVFLLILGFIGTSGNALVLYVFSSKRDGLVSTLFITVLAVVDMTTCLFIVPFTVVMELVDFNVGKSDFICKLYQFLITSNIPFSALVMAAIAVDRYLCICRPFVRVLTVTRARWVVVSLALFAGGLGLGGSLTHGVYRRTYVNQTWNDAYDESNDTTLAMTTTPGLFEETTFDANTSGSAEDGIGDWIVINTGYCVPTDLLLSEQFGLAFQKCYNGVFLGCLLVVSVLYGLIFRSVRQRRLWREKHKSSAAMTVTATHQSVNPPNQHHHQQLPPPGAEMLSAVEAPGKGSRTKSSEAEVATNKSICGSEQAIMSNAVEKTNQCQFDDRIVTGEVNPISGLSSESPESEQSHQQQLFITTAKSVCTDAPVCADDVHSEPPNDVIKVSYKRDEAGGYLYQKLTTSTLASETDDGGRTSSNDNSINSQCGTALLVVIEPDRSSTSVSYAEPNTGNGGKKLGNNGHCCGTGSHSGKTALVANFGTGGGGGGGSNPVSGGMATSLAAAQKNRIANVKTAAMLFVVTLVFVLTFMPALSMTVQLIPYNMTVFYMYFANNVANPIIYSFMNQNFRKQLKRLFTKRQGSGGRNIQL